MPRCRPAMRMKFLAARYLPLTDMASRIAFSYFILGSHCRIDS
jgi:hypothetical protein